MSVTAIVALCLLLLLPAFALNRLASSVDWRILVGAPIAVSIYTFFAYRTDKRRAEAGEWRISEANLHLAELLGGWPGAFLAQRKFRHKISKTSYQVSFWLIVLVYQFVAVDCLLDWQFTNEIWHFVNSKHAS